MIKPFLLLQIRPENEASDNEYEAFLKFSGLKPSELKRCRIEKNGVPNDISLDDYSGIIVGGGPGNVSDSIDKKIASQKLYEQGLTKLLDEIIIKDFPFLGTCYGLGLLNKQTGGLVNKKNMPNQ